MRAAKTAIGMLCFLSLLASIALFMYGRYIPTIPFREGGTYYRLEEPDTLGMAMAIADGGLDGSDNTLLERYVKQEVKPQWEVTGGEAARQAMDHYHLKPSQGHNNLVAAAVLDQRGRVIAAYPKAMVGRVFPFDIPISQLKDSVYRDVNGEYQEESAETNYPYWTSTFRDEASKYSDQAGQIMLSRLKNPAGDTIGVLAVSVKHDLEGINLPAGVDPPDRGRANLFGQLSLAALILYLVLLPLWVGMDAHWRGMRPYAWASLAAITNVIGFGAYLVARLPGPYPCANCGEEVLGKYVRCPACGVSLMNHCPICRTKMKPSWQYCPVCNISPTQVVEPKSPAEPLVSRLMENTRANLQVTVLDTETGAPMPNARVSVSGRMSKIDGMTSATGFFEARRLRGGKYTVTVTRAGYESAEAELDIGEAPESVQLSLRAMPSRIIGRVIERGTTRPVAGVRVYIDSSRLERSTLTGGEGGFVLEDIPAGPYTVAVDSVGFRHQTRLAEVAPGQQVTLDFSIEPAGNMV